MRRRTRGPAKYAFDLDLEPLRRALARGAAVEGLLLAAASAHDAEPRLQEAALRLLIRRGADVNETDKNGVTPLHRAVRFRSAKGVKTLLECGAEVNAVDRRTRSTPLHRAVTSTGAPQTAGKARQVREIIKLLLAHGADPTIRNRAGKTAADYVTKPEIKRLLTRP
jgi:ankyrin repeat protein